MCREDTVLYPITEITSILIIGLMNQSKGVTILMSTFFIGDVLEIVKIG